MGKKKKDKNKSKKNNSSNLKQEPVVIKELTKDDVINSETEQSFKDNKDKYINDFLGDVEELENAKKFLEDEIRAQTEKLSLIKDENEILEKQYKELEENNKALKEEFDNSSEKIATANEDAENILFDANAKAEEIKKQAEEERIKIQFDASKRAKDAYKNEAEKLAKELDDISKREIELNDKRRALASDKRDFEDEKSEFQEYKKYINTLEERFKKCNPQQVEQLTMQLNDAENKYEDLLSKYYSNREKLTEKEILFDTIKTEIEDIDGRKHLSSLNEIVSEVSELRKKYDDIQAVYKKYPDSKSIDILEEKASQIDKLVHENDVLVQERNSYREEVVAAKNLSREYEVIKREVEATNALNEHLLQELESHKTALESRTGDTCPSLSKVDMETENPGFIKEINRLTNNGHIKSLSELVEHIRNYAGSRSKAEQLYYTRDDIRAFISGMAVSRLLILQGMSGTGKSSLPRIISESISGFNKLIPVESSWRDRNELLGYYNDFNKKFNAKSFTIELYRDSKEICREIPSFIVLDEMNLARVEYYFSDFLAILQEPDPEKWLIELVASDMRTLPMGLPKNIKKIMKEEEPSIYEIWQKIERSRRGDLKSETSDDEKEKLTGYLAKIGSLTGAKDLIDGRKIKVTNNIWFIGTANQDESTFEISDKVYDRAQIVSLNKKGMDEGDYTVVKKRTVSVDDLNILFRDAIESYNGRDEVISRLNKLDDILVEKFDVSFGNRIVTQTIDFAAVFEAAGGKLITALDYQISTKILRKVISSDDIDAFAELQNVTSEYPETQRLINKRIKELL